jgi:NitT/TauT family transport system ATP-binding protein
MPIIEARHISHYFSASDGGMTFALEDVSFSLETGTFTCLIGASGSGKSTLLRILAGLVSPMAGEVIFDGSPLTRPQRRISIIFQKDNLMPWRTVVDNIALPLQLAGVSVAKKKDSVQQLIEVVGLQGFENQYPAELSGGMIQRVAIARGLITQPDVLLLDEPFGALDAMTREEMWHELLRVWATTHATVFMVTHSIEEAVFLADRVMVLSSRPGQLIGEFEIPFPRPRALNLLTDTRFHYFTGQIRTTIRK